MSNSKDDLIWDNRTRITTLEANYRHLTKTVDAIDGKVDQILENHLPHIHTQINKNKWQVGLIIGIGAAVGSGIISVVIQSLL